VRPKNDVPYIELRRGALLRLAKGTKKLLPSTLFDVKDPDGDARYLSYVPKVTNIIDNTYVHNEAINSHNYKLKSVPI
jgi:hypothetical protein